MHNLKVPYQCLDPLSHFARTTLSPSDGERVVRVKWDQSGPLFTRVPILGLGKTEHTLFASPRSHKSYFFLEPTRYTCTGIANAECLGVKSFTRADAINEARQTLNLNIFKDDHDDQPRPITYFLARKWGTGRLRS